MKAVMIRARILAPTLVLFSAACNGESSAILSATPETPSASYAVALTAGSSSDVDLRGCPYIPTAAESPGQVFDDLGCTDFAGGTEESRDPPGLDVRIRTFYSRCNGESESWPSVRLRAPSSLTTVQAGELTFEPRPETLAQFGAVDRSRCTIRYLLRPAGSRSVAFLVAGQGRVEATSDAYNSAPLSCDLTTANCERWIAPTASQVQVTLETLAGAPAPELGASTGCSLPEVNGIVAASEPNKYTATFLVTGSDASCNIRFPDPAAGMVQVGLEVSAGTSVEYWAADSATSTQMCDGGTNGFTCGLVAPSGQPVMFSATPIADMNPVWSGACVADSTDPWRASIPAASDGSRCSFEAVRANCDTPIELSAVLSGGDALERIEGNQFTAPASGAVVVDLTAVAGFVEPATFSWERYSTENVPVTIGSGPQLASQTVEFPFSQGSLSHSYLLSVTDACGTRSVGIRFQRASQ